MADNITPVSFKKLFNFDDTTNIDEAIKKIEQLDQVYELLVSHAKKNSEKYAESLDLIAKSADKLEKQLIDLDATEKKNQEAVLKSASQTEQLLKSQENSTKAFKDEQIALAMLTEAQNKLASSKEKLKSQTVLEAGSLGALKKELKEASALYESYGDATDSAVKQATLDKIKGLSKAVADGDTALKNAKKGVELAAGSYNSLAAQVASAKQRLKEMEGGIGSSSKEFKNLQKFAADGTKQLKEFDNVVGDNQRNVGNYKDALNALPGPLQAIAGGLQSAYQAGVAFLASPIGLVIAAVGIALGSLLAYFKRSTEGQDDLNKVLAIANALFQTLLSILEPLGKALFKAISEPGKAFKQLSDLLQPLTNKIKAVFENPVESLKKFGQLLVDNVINRFKAVGVAISGIDLLLHGKIKEGLKELGNAFIQSTTGITHGVDLALDALEKAAIAVGELEARIAAEAARRIALAKQIADLEAKIRKDKIADVIDDSKTELQVTKELFDAKNKLKFSDEQRFEFLQAANNQLEEQLKGDLELTQEQIDLVDLQIKQDGATYELLEKRAQLEAEYNNQQTAFFSARKRRQQQEIALIKEIDKETQDAIKRQQTAERNLNLFILQGVIDSNKEILADERSTSDQRVEAILAIADAQNQVAEETKDAALAAAKEEAIGLINLDDDTLTKIYNNQSISINDRIAQERAAKELLLEQDQSFVDNRTRINAQFLSSIEKSNSDAAKAIHENVFTQLEKDFKHLDNVVQAGASNQIDVLNKAYLDGNISASQLAKERQKIQDKAQLDSLNAQLDYLQKYSDNLKAQGKDTTAIDKQIAAVRASISGKDADDRIAAEQRVKEAVINLSNEVLSSVNQIVSDQTQHKIDNLNIQLNAEKQHEQEALQVAGDDAQAKAQIEANFAVQQKKIQKQISDERRKQAIFEKATAITQAGINTALAITNALGSSVPPLSFILAALVGAAGAVQIAAIASKPIPQYYTGIDDSPEGFALVGDRKGREIVHEPGRAPYIAEGPQIRYLKRHSIVYNNDDTESIMADAMRYGDGFGMPAIKGSFDNAQISSPHISIDMSGVRDDIRVSQKEIVKAISQMPKDHYDEYGFRRYERSEGLRVVRLDNRYRLG